MPANPTNRTVEFATLHRNARGEAVYHPYKPAEIDQLLKDEDVQGLIRARQEEENK